MYLDRKLSRQERRVSFEEEEGKEEEMERQRKMTDGLEGGRSVGVYA